MPQNPAAVLLPAAQGMPACVLLAVLPGGIPPPSHFGRGLGVTVIPAERSGRGRCLRGQGVAGMVMGGDAGPNQKSKVGVLGARLVFWGLGEFTPHPQGVGGCYLHLAAADFSLLGLGRATSAEH